MEDDNTEQQLRPNDVSVLCAAAQNPGAEAAIM